MVFVTDTAGAPIAGARVSAGGAVTREGVTGREGTVRLQSLRAGQYRLHLEADGFVPVIAPIGVGEGGEAYNINGDTAAAAVAAAVSAEKFVLLTDVPGVLDANGARISTMTGAEAESAIRSGAITGGMIPKVECGLAALRAGVRKVHVLDGRVPHSVLLEIFTDAGIGTEIVRAGGGAGGE